MNELLKLWEEIQDLEGFAKEAAEANQRSELCSDRKGAEHHPSVDPLHGESCLLNSQADGEPRHHRVGTLYR